MGKHFFFFSLMLLLCCGKTQKQNSSNAAQFQSDYIDRKLINNRIRRLVRTGMSDKALKLIDSLMHFNTKDGFLYYERGFIKGHNFRCEEAIIDFKRAESLNYDKSKCEVMIESTKIILNAKIK